MSAPKKAVPDVTIYVEEYATYIANPTREGAIRWDTLWPMLSASQRAKLAKLAKLAREFDTRDAEA